MSDVASPRWLLYTAGITATAITCYLCTRRIRRAPGADDDDDRDPADFGAFLKKRTTGPRQPPPKHLRDPADFGAFLKSTYTPDAQMVHAGAPTTGAPSVPSGPRADQAVVTVLYGTEYGFAKEIAEVLCEKLTSEQGETIWYACVSGVDWVFDVSVCSAVVVCTSSMCTIILCVCLFVYLFFVYVCLLLFLCVCMCMCVCVCTYFIIVILHTPFNTGHSCTIWLICPPMIPWLIRNSY